MTEHAKTLERLLAPFAREGKTWGPTHATTAVGICELGFAPTEAEFSSDDLKSAADFLKP